MGKTGLSGEVCLPQRYRQRTLFPPVAEESQVTIIFYPALSQPGLWLCSSQLLSRPAARGQHRSAGIGTAGLELRVDGSPGRGTGSMA